MTDKMKAFTAYDEAKNKVRKLRNKTKKARKNRDKYLGRLERDLKKARSERDQARAVAEELGALSFVIEHEEF